MRRLAGDVEPELLWAVRQNPGILQRDLLDIQSMLQLLLSAKPVRSVCCAFPGFEYVKGFRV